MLPCVVYTYCFTPPNVALIQTTPHTNNPTIVSYPKTNTHINNTLYIHPQLVRQLSNLGVKHRYWASLRAHLPNLLPGSHQRHTSSSGTPTTPGSSWTSKPHPPSGGAFAGTGEGTPTPTPAASGGGDNAQRAQRAPGLSSVVGVGTSQGGRHTEGGTSGAATTSMQQPGGRQDRKRRRTPMELRGVVDAVLLRKPKPPSPAVRPPGGVSPAEHTTTAAGGALGGGGEAMEVDTVGALPALGALPIAAPMVFAPAPAAAAVPGALGAAVPAVPAAGVPPAVPATAPSEGVLELASTATPFDGGAASMWSNQTSTVCVVYVCVCVWMYIWMCVCVYIHTHTYVYVYVYVYVMCIC